ncbi:type VII toxin-antitoxin system MntA family adenylyltransferase antitoxin [Desulforamulus aquiferis]|uniref:Nucleotidyltransferase domain-containing protein n=1 Tax=Desulforamulus aquiferis TaxID=1397668 RepID=A0AAW7ZB24_9FIRM|nr:nucleotidyltransferase domain-containing protein [Desulforamulus aquiferis]MDO7786874.1 nucleotidyltransferase domain-containing protein [Desulforamulus aquiferis]
MDKLIAVKQILSNYPDIIAVYLFGSYIEDKKRARDIDLAILTKDSAKSLVNIYMKLYPQLAELFSPLEVDLLFLKNASLALSLEIISKGKVIYCCNDDIRTDYEYYISGRYMDFSYHLETGYKELYESVKDDLGV